jgi:mycoredoxin
MAERVTVYGADWCGDTRRALQHLDTRGVQYDYINIDNDTDGEKKVIEFNNGKRRIPLVEVGDKAMSVPSTSELDSALS